MRTLYAGKKTDLVLGHIAKTFVALCECADFSAKETPKESAETPKTSGMPQAKQDVEKQAQHGIKSVGGTIVLDSLQYQIRPLDDVFDIIGLNTYQWP